MYKQKYQSIRFYFCRIHICYLLIFSSGSQLLKSQNYEANSIIYNSLVGGVSGGIGAIINKHEGQKWHKAFVKGFIAGTGGGLLMYGGKKVNYLIGNKHEIGYAWLSRAVFSVGNSIVENASANINLWSRWHFDIGFVRLEFNTGPFNLTPRLMPSSLGGVVFLVAHNGELNLQKSLFSGTLIFQAKTIDYAPKFSASTPSNAMLLTSGLKGNNYYITIGHEMIHAFQFQELSGINYFFKPLSDKWKAGSKNFTKISKWIYLDLNYELMGINYFLVNRGYKKYYCNNFLEQEAGFLSTGPGNYYCK